MAKPSVMMEHLGNVLIQWDKWMRELYEDCEVFVEQFLPAMSVLYFPY